MKRVTRFASMMSYLFLLFLSVRPVDATTSPQSVGCLDPLNQKSLVEVLEQTGVHSTFLNLMQEVDPEGYAILTDAQLSDKTIWAPTDSAFQTLDVEFLNAPLDELKRIIGYHISPPLSRPNGDYPIITFEYLEANPTQRFRTRTGVLTASDQRLSLRVVGDTYLIEDARIGDTVWCAAAGSVFSIDQVIVDVEPPSLLLFTAYRLERILLYEDIRFTIYATVAAMGLGIAISWYLSRQKRRGL